MTNSKRCVILLTLHFNSQKAAAEGGLTTTQGGLGPACAQEKHLEQQTALPGPSTRKHPNQKFNRESYTCIYRYIHMHISVYLSHICRNAHLHTRNVPPKEQHPPPTKRRQIADPQKASQRWRWTPKTVLAVHIQLTKTTKIASCSHKTHNI